MAYRIHSIYTDAMQGSSSVNRSIDLILTMFVVWLVLFGCTLYRLLTSNYFAYAWRTSDAKTPRDKVIVSLKMIALTMAIPWVYFIVTILGELPNLWHAFPFWSSYTALLLLLLFVLIASLFYVDRENVEEFSIESSYRERLEKQLRKRIAEKRIIGFGFGLWIVGMAISLTWLLQYSERSLYDVIRDF